MTALSEERGFRLSDDGYGYIEEAAAGGWHPISGWGLDGWDCGDWPYVIVFHRRDGERWGQRVHVEGDLTTRWYATEAERDRATDETAHWYWRHGQSVGPDTPDLQNAAHCGPFSWRRLATSQHPDHAAGMQDRCDACAASAP